MAFDFTPNPVNTPVFVNRSEGIRSDRNSALGTLFEGLAQSLEMGVKFADEQVQRQIQTDIFDEVDAIQNEFFVGDMTDTVGQVEGPARDATNPTAIVNAANQLGRLQSAYQAGGMKESHYWARLNSMVKGLRSRYPGYRAEIDQMVSSVTGNRPANALRAALFREWESAHGEDELGKLQDWAMKQGYLPVDYFQRQGENPYSLTELQAHVSRKTAAETEIKARRDQIALHNDQGSLQKNDASRAFTIEANQTVTSLLQDASTVAGANYQQIRQRLTEAQRAAAAGQPMDQAQVDQLRGMMGELRQTVAQTLHQSSIASWDGDPNHSYMASGMTPEERDRIVSEAMRPIQIIEDALNSDNPWGVLGAMSAHLEAQKLDSSRDLLRDMPFAQEMAAMSNVLGSDVLSQYLTLSPTLHAEIDQALLDYRKLRAARAASNGETIADAFADFDAKDRPADVAQSMIDHWTALIDQVSDPNIPTSLIQNNIQYMFGAGSDRVMSILNDTSRYEYFKKVASPIVSRRMGELRDQGDIDSWNMYQTWVARSFQILFTDKVSIIQDMVTDPNRFAVSWDNTAKRFDVDIRLFGDTFIRHPLAPNVQQLNDTIQVIAPIIEANNGDTGKEILNMLYSMGYDPEAPESTLSSFVRAIFEKLSASARQNSDVLDRGVAPALGAE